MGPGMTPSDGKAIRSLDGLQFSCGTDFLQDLGPKEADDVLMLWPEGGYAAGRLWGF